MDVARIDRWIARDPDPATRSQLQALKNAQAPELEKLFGGRLSFGTAGLRGVIGPGPTHMNRLVVRETAAGLSEYLLETVRDAATRGVVVGYDGRTLSYEFAQDCAATVAACGLKVYLAQDTTPTPLIAFATKHLHAAAGVVITASHNPPEYNGLKVYWENGAQIIPPHDDGIAARIAQAAQDELPWMELEQAQAQGIVESISASCQDAYFAGLRNLLGPAEDSAASVKIAYTAMHGVGHPWVARAFTDYGFAQVSSVTSQQDPDPSFSTVAFPNPEEPGAMDRVLDLAKEIDAALVLAHDPDADRLAVAVRDDQGALQQLTGDQVGVLLGADAIERNTKPHPVVATTIVSSQLLERIAKSFGAGYFETLTGLKWIANGAIAHEARGETFVFGYEEALGYQIGTHVLCKDGISAAVAFGNLTARLLQAGSSPWHKLQQLYATHGRFVSGQVSLRLQDGADPSVLSQKLRKASWTELDGKIPESFDDLLDEPSANSPGYQDLPRSNVLIWRLVNSARVIVRPSGTEPKLKCYYEICSSQDANSAQKELDALISAHQSMVQQVIGQ